jgi:NADPH2:quinone reductase
MKAIVVTAFGGPEVLKLQDVPEPKAGAGELLIRVQAAGVNPVDTYVREGKYPGLTAKPPFIAGTELAGEVVEGPRKGERVYSPQTTLGRNLGAYAEFVVVQHAWRLPDHLSFAEGAAIPVAFGTAYRALVDVGRMKPGEFVLIHGASGGVGNAATQIAASLGAVVIGTASTPEGQQAVRDAGANFVFNHKDDGYREQIKAATGGKGVDVIIEFLANVNLNHDLDMVGKLGRIVVVGSRGPVEIDARRSMGKESSITGMSLWNDGIAGIDRAYAAVGALFERHAMRPVVGTELPLADAAKAQELVMRGGSAGKIVLTL